MNPKTKVSALSFLAFTCPTEISKTTIDLYKTIHWKTQLHITKQERIDLKSITFQKLLATTKGSISIELCS